MKRILIVNLNWRGDVLFSTPFIKTLRKNYPRSFIACMTAPRCHEILLNNPDLDQIIIYDEDGIHRGLAGKLRFISELKKGNFDTAFFLHRSFTRRLLTFFAGIPQRIGYDTKKKGFLLTRKIKPPQKSLHRIDYFLNLANAAGMKTEDKNYEFFIAPADQEYANNWLTKQGISTLTGTGKKDFLAVINPGGNWLLKRWPKENFARLADALVRRYGAKVVISGAAKDIALAQAITAAMEKEAAISCGQTDLRQLGGILRRANLVISNDSGPMHIALAVKCGGDENPASLISGNTQTVVALFGPTSPEITGPGGGRKYIVLYKDVGCSIPCYNLSCPDNRCMQAISVEDVLDKIQTIEIQNPNTTNTTK